MSKNSKNNQKPNSNNPLTEIRINGEKVNLPDNRNNNDNIRKGITFEAKPQKPIQRPRTS